MNCPICNIPMKLVAAGVSRKTGRAYSAFWSCPSGNNTHVINIETRPSAPQPRVQQPQVQQPIPQVASAKPDNAVQIALEEREVRIARESIISSLCELVAGHADSIGKSIPEIVDEIIIPQADKLVEYVYNGIPENKNEDTNNV